MDSFYRIERLLNLTVNNNFAFDPHPTPSLKKEREKDREVIGKKKNNQ